MAQKLVYESTGAAARQHGADSVAVYWFTDEPLSLSSMEARFYGIGAPAAMPLSNCGRSLRAAVWAAIGHPKHLAGAALAD